MTTSLAMPIEQLGSTLRKNARIARDCVDFLGACVRSALRYNPAARRFSIRTFLNQIRFTVTNAVPLASTLGFLSGLMIIAQSQGLAVKLGIAKTLGDILATILIRELGPLLAAITIVARSGTAMSSEMATSRILGEFDAMEAAGIDPLQVFVLPRIAACAVGVTVLTVLFDAIALFGGLVATWWLAHLPPSDYVASLKLALGATVFGLVLIKAAICGAGIAFISCWAGMRTPGNAIELPRSVTRGTVLSLLYVFLLSATFAFLAIQRSAWLSP
jgi:phospholipid/cholesterol/gamma-HCH transport system permease protein